MTAKCECRMGTVESNFSKSVENIAFYKYVLWWYGKYLPFFGLWHGKCCLLFWLLVMTTVLCKELRCEWYNNCDKQRL